MNNNFSISEWRRQQFHKEIIKEDLTRILENEEEADMKKYRKEVLQQLLTWYKKQDKPDQNMVKKLESEIGNLNEDVSLQKAQKYPKEIITNFDFVRLPKRKAGPGSGVDVFSKEEFEQIFDLIPDDLMYTMSSFSVDAQQAIPTFLFSKGGWWKDEELNYGDKGNMDKSIDYQIKRDIELGKEPRLD